MVDFDKNGYHICELCNGQRIVPSKTNPSLIEVCPKCNGQGGFDWVENAMGRINKKSKDTVYYVSNRNIQILAQMLVDEGRKIGQEIDVNIRNELTISSHTHNCHSYFYKGGD